MNAEDTNAGPLGRIVNPLPNPLLYATVNILKFHYPGFQVAALDLTLSGAALLHLCITYPKGGQINTSLTGQCLEEQLKTEI